MDHHPHIHAVVPGGGPSLDGERWVKSRHPTQPRRREPYLTDNVDLGREFRKQFVNGLRRMIRRDKLRIDGGYAFLRDPAKREAWLKKLQATDWNVFIKGPPQAHSQPEHVVKYLARYMSGGPIADRRLIREEDEKVIFWARSKDKSKNNSPERFTLRGHEFVRRWTMHILPKGYTRSRSYGGFHGSKRQDYLSRCRQLLEVSQDHDDSPRSSHDEEPRLPKCVRCKISMDCIVAADRPSWREIFNVTLHRDPHLYSPLHHMPLRTLRAAHAVDGYG